jgi:glycosyltransferase involved in cell wall biosynthesis
MRLLFVTAHPPSRLYPRTHGFVTRLAGRHNVTVVCLCQSPREFGDVSRLRALGIKVLPVFPRHRNALLRATSRLLHWQSTAAASVADPGLREIVRSELSCGDVGVVHVGNVGVAGAVAGLPVPVVWDAEELTGLLAGSQQPQLLEVFQRALVESPRERKALLAASLTHASGASERIQVISSGVDLAYFSRVPGRRHTNRLVFGGKMSAPSTCAAADVLVRGILPLIWRERPDVQLTIVGADPTRRILAYAREDARITVTGYVEDLRPYLSGAALAISPLPYAAGMPHLVLEAMAMGTPVIVSESAVAALAVVPGRDALLASSTERFAQLALRLLDDSDLRHLLAHNGQRYVERHHSLDVQTHRLESVYSEVSSQDFAIIGLGMTRELPSFVASGE